MDNSTIGIKIADGTFFPILEEDSSGKKKLVLTTVNDDQESVQIDLYKGEGQKLNDALYIGSLVIEDIIPSVKGEPEIELIIGIDEEGNLDAKAGDMATSDRQSLSVSLESLDEGDFASPNFELDETAEDDGSFEDMLPVDEPSLDDEMSFDDEPSLDDEMSFDDEPSLDDEMSFDDEPSLDDGISFDDEPSLDDEMSFDDEPSLDDEMSFDDESTFEDSDENDSEESYTDEKKRRSPVAFIVLLILILAILGLGALLIIRGMNGDSVPPLEADNSPAATESEYAQPAEPEPEIVAQAEPEPPVKTEVVEVPQPAEEKPVETEKQSYDTVPPEGHGGGVWYRLKWGDTLWDLSNSFYRTPWLYGLIAVENKIKNPDIIYAGTDILIPEN